MEVLAQAYKTFLLVPQKMLKLMTENNHVTVENSVLCVPMLAVTHANVRYKI